LKKQPDPSGWGQKLPGELYARWPKDESGQPEPPVLLTHCSGLNLEDALLVSTLEACGIPALRKPPGNGDFGRLILGVSGCGVDIFVPATMWEDAHALLSAQEEDAIYDE